MARTPWEQSTGRKRTSTAKWRRFSAKILRRDPVCVICGQRPSVNAHHLVQPEDRPDLEFDLQNVVGACLQCHGSQTGKQGAAARWRVREKREQEAHPGLLPAPDEPEDRPGGQEPAQDAPRPPAPAPAQRPRNGVRAVSLVPRPRR